MIGLMHPPIGLLLFVVANIGRLPLKPVVIEFASIPGMVDLRALPRDHLSANHHMAAGYAQIGS